MKRILILAALAGACTQTPRAPTAAPVAEAKCEATAAQAIIGKPFDSATAEAARTAATARTIRLIRPGAAVTKDYREDRLNVDVDVDDVVTGVRCG